MPDLVRFDVENGIGVVTIDSPPVNALSQAVRAAILSGVGQALADNQAQALIIMCAGRTFFAGADIAEFEGEEQKPLFAELMYKVEGSSKLTVAAIHGTALGGGLELALSCNYRVAVPSAKLGLPEVTLGILPGAGGTQRLPRLVGVPMALDMITSGRPIGAKQALDAGVVDALVEEGKLREDAIAYARKLVDEGAALKRVRDLDDKIAACRGKPEVFDDFLKKNARAFRGFKAPGAIVECIRAAVDLPFEEGMKKERALFEKLLVSPESAAQRYAFFAERFTAKVPDIGKDTPRLPIKTVGVLGAGTMGGGITMNFLNVGIPVTLVEVTEAALDRGVSVIRKNYENSAKKGRMSAADVDKRMALLTPKLDFNALAEADLVIEAVFEQMSLKKEIFAKLDKTVKKGAILASNTSFLDLNEIAASTNRPEDVIGLHFFSPANVMRLLEVVRGDKTSKSVIATAMDLAKAIRKVPVLAGVCDGFIANRAMMPRVVQADRLVLEGVKPEEVDRVSYDYGFAMGPFQMMDLVGLDVVGRDSDTDSVMKQLVAMGRLGQKQGGGYYDYDENRKATPSVAAASVIAEFAARQGIKQKAVSDDDILARILYPVVNEGAKILDEGIAIRASDIDVALMLGYGWPVFKGGPMFWAEMVGLDKIVAKLREFEADYGSDFTPSPLLVKMAAEGKSFREV